MSTILFDSANVSPLISPTFGFLPEAPYADPADRDLEEVAGGGPDYCWCWDDAAHAKAGTYCERCRRGEEPIRVRPTAEAIRRRAPRHTRLDEAYAAGFFLSYRDECPASPPTDMPADEREWFARGVDDAGALLHGREADHLREIERQAEQDWAMSAGYYA